MPGPDRDGEWKPPAPGRSQRGAREESRGVERSQSGVNRGGTDRAARDSSSTRESRVKSQAKRPEGRLRPELVWQLLLSTSDSDSDKTTRGRSPACPRISQVCLPMLYIIRRTTVSRSHRRLSSMPSPLATCIISIRSASDQHQHQHVVARRVTDCVALGRYALPPPPPPVRETRRTSGS